MTTTLPNCADVCGAEDRTDCYEMQNSTVEEMWERVHALAIGIRLTKPEGICPCDCHNEFDEP